jgi:hypothetical protein
MRTIITNGIIEASCLEKTIQIKDVVNKTYIGLSTEEFISIMKLAVDSLSNDPEFDSGMKEVISRYLKSKI